MICTWCQQEHEFEAACTQRDEAFERMRKRGEERRREDLDLAREWPPKERVVRDWVAHGLRCVIAHGGVSLCGYVLVPDGHPDERKGYDDVDVDVHGGLTFRCKAAGGGSWFGFDCAHGGDWFGIAETGFEMPGRIWTEDDVAIETEHLAQQFSERVSK